MEYNGIVLWYNDRLGYGIINGTDNKTYFIHHNDIINGSMDKSRHRNHLQKGEKVLFDWGWKAACRGVDSKRNRQAFNLSVINSNNSNAVN